MMVPDTPKIRALHREYVWARITGFWFVLWMVIGACVGAITLSIWCAAIRGYYQTKMERILAMAKEEARREAFLQEVARRERDRGSEES